MRRILIVAASATLALAAPALAAESMRGTAGGDALTSGAEADAAKLARDACRTEKRQMGTKVFKLTYAAKSTAKAKAACVGKAQPVAATELKNAAKTCKAERDSDAAAFTEKYGLNKNGKNALGQCVSTTAKEAVEDTTKARVSAAAACKTERDADAAAFAEKYGSDQSRKKAFGKCVSAAAKAGDDDQA